MHCAKLDGISLYADRQPREASVLLITVLAPASSSDTYTGNADHAIDWYAD